MQQDQMMSLMKAYFADLHGPEGVENFEEIRGSDLIEDSVDLMTFFMHLEEETGRDIPLTEVGPAFTGLTIKELAGELCCLLNKPRP